ncbi:MAG: LLM class flavin-dependent oxidoreductase [Solirubrobacterales bacterium]|nr:LLM class flavin-dependent oxidoreductase [Solirubrobacterales bacterium]
MPAIRWGLTVPFAGVPLGEQGALFRAAEQAGYDDLWSGETANGHDGFTPLVVAATATERLRLVTGIVNPFTRGPGLLAQHAAALQQLSGGRFVLGLGASSDVIVERFNDIPFERPLSRVREAVERLRPVLSVPAERGHGGLRLENPVTVPVPIVLAALRGKMLALAAEVADGAFTNFLPIGGARTVAAAFAAPGKELACRFFWVPQPEAEGIGAARFMFAAYGSVPVYTAFFSWLGWGEQVEPMAAAWRAGDRQRALELVPDDLVREIFLFGEAAAVRDRLRAFEEAGITTFVLTPIAEPGALPDLMEAMAPG